MFTISIYVIDLKPDFLLFIFLFVNYISCSNGFKINLVTTIAIIMEIKLNDIISIIDYAIYELIDLNID